MSNITYRCRNCPLECTTDRIDLTTEHCGRCQHLESLQRSGNLQLPQLSHVMGHTICHGCGVLANSADLCSPCVEHERKSKLFLLFPSNTQRGNANLSPLPIPSSPEKEKAADLANLFNNIPLNCRYLVEAGASSSGAAPAASGAASSSVSTPALAIGSTSTGLDEAAFAGVFEGAATSALLTRKGTQTAASTSKPKPKPKLFSKAVRPGYQTVPGTSQGGASSLSASLKPKATKVAKPVLDIGPPTSMNVMFDAVSSHRVSIFRKSTKEYTATRVENFSRETSLKAIGIWGRNWIREKTLFEPESGISPDLPLEDEEIRIFSTRLRSEFPEAWEDDTVGSLLDKLEVDSMTAASFLEKKIPNLPVVAGAYAPCLRMTLQITLTPYSARLHAVQTEEARQAAEAAAQAEDEQTSDSDVEVSIPTDKGKKRALSCDLDLTTSDVDDLEASRAEDAQPD
ncbi:hypothetical protein JCM5353_005432, partial [Sporobolomyces roseus]